MNGAAIRQWALIRMCNRAQKEIRDLCTKMVGLAKEAAPELMEGVGPKCVAYGYCEEGEQCSQFKGIIPTKNQVMDFIKNNREVFFSNKE